MSALSWSDVSPVLSESGYVFPSFRTAASVINSNGVMMSAGDQNTIFPLASVTKLLASWAILVAVDRGLCSLDQPVALHGVPEGITLRHLLSHSSGAPMEADASFQEKLRRRNYSNFGIELAAHMVEDAAATPFPDWLRLAVLAPLGMENTQLRGSAAHGGHSSIADLQRFAAEILSTTLVTPDLAAEAFHPQFPELGGIVPGYGRFTPCPWGLGFEIRGSKEHWMPANSSPDTVGHFGQAGSYLWVDHSRNLAGLFLGEQPFGQWHKENWGRLNTAIVQIADSAA